MSTHREPSDANRASGHDYGYCNARIRGMWAKLLREDTLEALVSASDVEAQIRILSDTSYAAQLEESLIHGHTVAAIDRALRENLGRTSKTVHKILPRDGVGLVSAVLARWDVFDIKTILRGVHAHSTPAEILESLMPTATLLDAELEELARAEDVNEVVDTLATWRMPFARPLNDAMAAYREKGSTAPLELALDRWFFERAYERLKKGRGYDREIVREVLQTTVDVENLRTLFRIAGAHFSKQDARDYWLSGGKHITEKLFVRLSESMDPDGVLDGLRGTPYSRPLEAAAATYLKEGTLSVLERALEDTLTRKIISYRRPDPLCIGVVIAFLWAKQNEVTNVRIAVTGRSVGLPEERLRRELILV